LRSVFLNSPPPKPEVILTNFFAEPTVLLVPITSRDNIKREILTNSYEDGRLKMIDIKLFCQALKMTWIKKYIDPLNIYP
jgi:hypothetical protein